jgi:hypothetical protein
MNQLFDELHAAVGQWRARNQERRGGVVLVWEGQVYGWKGPSLGN